MGNVSPPSAFVLSASIHSAGVVGTASLSLFGARLLLPAPPDITSPTDVTTD